ncbi:MAG: hypothetical protein WCI11_18230 [Candidatus Methylumidiphilus sp.]
MKHRIDPKIDCVFKALLGSEGNRNLLVHFLNAVLVDDFDRSHAPAGNAFFTAPAILGRGAWEPSHDECLE